MPSKVIETFPQRVALEARRPDLAVLIGVTIALGFIAQQGDVLGVTTSSGQARRRTRTTAAGSGFAINATTGQVADASVFVPGDVVKDATGATVGTIAAGGVNTTTNILTLTANASVAVAAGAAVLGSDGSQTAKAIADETTDGSADASVSVFVCGLLDESRLRGLDATAKAELGGASVAGEIFKF